MNKPKSKTSEKMQELTKLLQVSSPELADCEQVATLIAVLQEWYSANCPGV